MGDCGRFPDFLLLGWETCWEKNEDIVDCFWGSLEGLSKLFDIKNVSVL